MHVNATTIKVTALMRRGGVKAGSDDDCLEAANCDGEGGIDCSKRIA